MNNQKPIILAIDTSTEACSVALQLEEQSFHLFEICPQQHSQKILPLTNEVLNKAGLTMAELDAIAFGKGPGSFTGVRIATGIVQGLAFGADLPVIGVSTLAIMAQEAIESTNTQWVVSAIDARMSEVYFAKYKNENGIATLIDEEKVIAPQQAQDLLPTDTDYVGVGTGWQDKLLQTTMPIGQVLYPNAKYMLPLAYLALQKGNVMSADNVKPSYLRDTVTWKKLPGRE